MEENVELETLESIAKAKAEQLQKERKPQTPEPEEPEAEKPELKAEVKPEVKPEIKPEVKPEEGTEEELEFNEAEFAEGFTGLKKKEATEATPEAKPEKEAPKTEELDPEIQYLLELKKAGKNPLEELAQAYVNDPAKLSPEQLYEYEIDALIKDGLPEAEAEELREAFKDKPTYEKLTLTRGIKSELVRERTALLERWKPDTSAMEAQAKRQERFTQEWNQIYQTLPEQTYMGMELTQERVAAVKEFIDTNKTVAFYKEDGSFDVQEAVEYALWKKYKKDIVGIVAKRAMEQAKKDVLSKRHRTSLDSNPGTTQVSQNDPKEAALKAIQAKYGRGED